MVRLLFQLVRLQRDVRDFSMENDLFSLYHIPIEDIVKASTIHKNRVDPPSSTGKWKIFLSMYLEDGCPASQLVLGCTEYVEENEAQKTGFGCSCIS